jgi:hypothetical protein
MRPNTTYLCRVEHVDVNAPPWFTTRNRAWNGGVRHAPQKVKLMYVSSC